VFNAPGYAPARTAKNLLGAVKHRLLATPPATAIDQGRAWDDSKAIHGSVTQLIREEWPVIERHLVEDKWWTHLADDGAKLAKMRRCEAKLKGVEISLDDPWFNVIDITLKTDELLFKRTDTGDVAFLGRTIANIAPEATYVVGPIQYETDSRLKQEWNDHLEFPTFIVLHDADTIPWGRYEQVHVYVVFTSGYTDERLSSVLNRFVFRPGNRALLMVQGDDSILFRAHENTIDYVIEADARKFDISQSVGPLRAQAEIDQALGATDIIALKRRLSQAKLSVRYKSDTFFIDRKNRAFRNTGGTDTTGGNTTVDVCAWFYALNAVHSDRWAHPGILESSFSYTGLSMKVNIHGDVSAATFLKGWWIQSTRGWWWTPLPSRILKASKSLHAFDTLFHDSGCREGRFARGARGYLALQAANLGQFAAAPILRAFVKRWGGAVPELRHADEVRPWKIQASGQPPELIEQEALQAIARRYGCEVSDVTDVEALIDKAPVHAFISHPLFEMMACVDYG